MILKCAPEGESGDVVRTICLRALQAMGMPIEMVGVGFECTIETAAGVKDLYVECFGGEPVTSCVEIWDRERKRVYGASEFSTREFEILRQAVIDTFAEVQKDNPSSSIYRDLSHELPGETPLFQLRESKTIH